MSEIVQPINGDQCACQYRYGSGLSLDAMIPCHYHAEKYDARKDTMGALTPLIVASMADRAAYTAQGATERDIDFEDIYYQDTITDAKMLILIHIAKLEGYYRG